VDGRPVAVEVERSLVRVKLPVMLLAVVLVASPLLPFLDLSSSASADSLPLWARVFHLHEGDVQDTGSYDWMNSSGPYNPTYSDYDSDGLWGITIRKWNPSEHWRHSWVLSPSVNSPVNILGDLSLYVFAKSRNNVSGTQITATFADMAPGELGDIDAWDVIDIVTVPLEGPVYSDFKLYNITASGVDYTLAEGHSLTVTLQRGDSFNDYLQIMFDQTTFDSYLVLRTDTFIGADSAWTETSEGVAKSLFSDTEDIVVRANVSNPFGSYDIYGAEVSVSYSGNGTPVLSPTMMVLMQTDPLANSSWALFSLTLPDLPGDDYVAMVYASDAQGSPTWLSFVFTVVSVDHFSVSAPDRVTAGEAFGMTVEALDDSDAVIPTWVGSVTIAAFLSDLVTPASGTLSVTTVEFTDVSAGSITIPDQTYDFAEEVIYIRAECCPHEGWALPITVASGPVFSLTVDPEGPLSIQAGDSRSFTVVAEDALGNVNTTWAPSWSVTGGIGAVTGSGTTITFTALASGTGYLQCYDPSTEIEASVEITVAAGLLASIEISPAGPLDLQEGETVPLTAAGYDELGNEVTLAGVVWSTNTSGQLIGLGSSATYRAGYIPEEGVIAVSSGGKTDQVTVTVTPPLGGPSLGTIPIQIQPEDSSWTLSLSTYWHHVNGSAVLSWFVEGVNTSLYVILHDTSSAENVKFLTQPNAYGVDVFRLWVRDVDGFMTYQDVTVSIQSVNDRPRFVNTPPTELYVKFDTPYTFDFSYYVSDVDTPKNALLMVSSAPDNIYFDRLLGTFMFPERDDVGSYFEIVKLTVSDAASEASITDANSDSLNLVVRVTDDTPPSLSSSLPDITLFEGEMDIWAFDLDDYFFDLDDDFLVFTYGFHDIEIFIDNETHEVLISAPTEWSGTTEGTFTAVDPVGALKTDTVTVTVIAVNDRPCIDVIGTLHVRYDSPLVFDVGAYISDPDHTLGELTVTFDSPYVSYASGSMTLLFPGNLSGPSFVDPYTVNVTVSVEDPLGDGATRAFYVYVSDNYPPVVSSPVPFYDFVTFPEDEYLNNSIQLDLLFLDEDDSELDYFYSGNTDIFVAIYYPGGVVNLTASTNWSGTEVITFMAFDSSGAWASWRLTVIVTPVNDPPVIRQIPDFIVAGGPRNSQYDISQYFLDSETSFSELIIVTEPSTNVAVVGKFLYVSLMNGVDRLTITIYAIDSDGAESNVVTFTVGVEKTFAEKILWPYSAPLFILAAAVGAFFVYRLIPKEFALEDLFLIHNDGRLITHLTNKESTNIDKDVVSAMFTAVQEFVKDSFQAGEMGLKKLEIGDSNVMIEKGVSVYIALIYSGRPPKEVFERLTMLLRDTEERFRGRIERWNGTKKALVGVDDMVKAFMDGKYRPGEWQPEEVMGEEEWVDILSKES
jgi:hypothetical protein